MAALVLSIVGAAAGSAMLGPVGAIAGESPPLSESGQTRVRLNCPLCARRRHRESPGIHDTGLYSERAVQDRMLVCR
jgi:hypothetical protein